MTATTPEAASSASALELEPCGRAASWWLAFAVAAAIFLFIHRGLLLGTQMPAGDGNIAFAPYYMHLADHVRARRFMLWDPWTNAGFPACAYTEFGTFSPLTNLAAWLTGPSLCGYEAYWCGVWLCGALGILLLARHLGAPAWGGLIVTLGFLFSGFFAEHSQHMSWMYSFSALGWIIWRLDVAFLERRWLPAAQAGAIWGLSALAGYPAVLMTTGAAAGLWLLGRAVCLPGNRLPALVRCLGLLSIYAAVGLVVLCPTIVTFLKETQGYSGRGGALPRDTVLNSNYLHARGFLSLATPYLPVWQGLILTWPNFQDWHINSLYLGFVVSWLALAALLLRPTDVWRWWLVAVAGLGLALAVGPSLPLRGWLYDYCPPSRYFRHSVVFQLLAMFAALVLAALATADLRRHTPAPVRGREFRLALAALLVAAAGVLGCHWAATIPGRPEVLPIENLLSGYIGWCSLIVLGVLALLAVRRPRWRLVFLAALCAVAIADAYQTSRLIEPLVGYTVEHPVAEWQRRVREHQSSLDIGALTSLDRKLEFSDPSGLKHLLERVPVFRAGLAMTLGYHVSWGEIPVLRDAAIGPRRIWFSPTAQELPWDAGAFHGFFVRANALGVPPLVVHQPEALLRPQPQSDAVLDAFNKQTAAAPPARPIDVVLDAYHPNKLEFRVDCPSDGWLVVTDRWAPGWSATVNGEPATIYGGMFIFRALQVRAGMNEIHFRYRPWGHPWLVILSYATLGLVLAATLRRRGTGDGESGARDWRFGWRGGGATLPGTTAASQHEWQS